MPARVFSCCGEDTGNSTLEGRTLRRITRRELLLGTAAVATAGFLATEGCQDSRVAGAPPDPHGAGYLLEAQYADHTYAGKLLRTRTYNGTIPGPTFHAYPGQQLTITLKNSLPPNPAEPIPSTAVVHPVDPMDMEAMDDPRRFAKSAGVTTTTIDPMNNPHAFNTTNLHVHGVQVVPHLFQPVGTSDPSAMMIALNSGESLRYDFAVPADHPPGLYWYHPHHHGSTDVQVSGGMAGLLVVHGAIDRVPEIAAARDIHIAVQTLQVNQDSANPNLYNLEYKAYQTPQNGGYNPRSQYMFVVTNGQLINLIDFTKSNFGVSTAYAPQQLQVQPGEVLRLRILNGTNALLLPLQLQGFEVYVIGHDGVNLLAPQQMSQLGTNAMNLGSGGRLELLVRAPQTPGTYTLRALAIGGPGVHPWPQFNIMQFVVGGSPVSMDIPTSLPVPTREYPLIQDSEIVGNRSVVFDSVASTSILPGFALTVNGVVYDEMSIMFPLAVGTAEQWTISNNMPEGHPFHLHTNSFEVHSVTDPVNGTVTYSPPVICDTVWVPAKGKVVMRVRYKQWRGKDVFHCHKLPHEDQGMMANTMLE
jgi:FtsP/CotA-like multicopper oxidase with cupredoxin domain